MAVFFVFLFVGTPSLVHTQTPDIFGLQPIEESTALSGGDIRVIVAEVIRAVLALLGIIALVLIMYAGYLIMTAAGSEERITSGKDVLRNAVIGLAIILSALAIVQFILNALSRATGFEGAGAPGAPSDVSSFAGSGALGDIVRDHYPFRDQSHVPRNTRISVTFREPINPASMIRDSNGEGGGGNGIIGDCIDPGDRLLDWAIDCDQLDTDVVQIYPSADDAARVPAAALAFSEGQNQEIYTVVFRPLDPLGSDAAPVSYTVLLTSQIEKADGSAAFSGGRFGTSYWWQFETDTQFDVSPPRVQRVYPTPGTANPRNTIVQITFTEAMDPSVVQGALGGENSFLNIIFGLPEVGGHWRVTNAYRTVEFLSDDACGENSCGDVMYCLPTTPVPCPAANPSCSLVLIRTAELLGDDAFEAIPFTGVTDMAGNALDGSDDGIPDGKPLMTGDAIRPIGVGEDRADNYSWDFISTRDIDRSAPYIESVIPGLDQENVPDDAPLEVTFNRPMWLSSFGDVALQEYGLSDESIPSVWYRVLGDVNAAGQTVLRMEHRNFGPNGLDAYYFPSIPSTVKSVTQNCLYPGRGPASNLRNSSPTCIYDEETDVGVDCAPVTRQQDTDTACVFPGAPSQNLWLQGDIASCLSELERNSPTTP